MGIFSIPESICTFFFQWLLMIIVLFFVCTPILKTCIKRVLFESYRKKNVCWITTWKILFRIWIKHLESGNFLFKIFNFTNFEAQNVWHISQYSNCESPNTTRRQAQNGLTFSTESTSYLPQWKRLGLLVAKATENGFLIPVVLFFVCQLNTIATAHAHTHYSWTLSECVGNVCASPCKDYWTNATGSCRFSSKQQQGTLDDQSPPNSDKHGKNTWLCLPCILDIHVCPDSWNICSDMWKKAWSHGAMIT